MVDDRKERERKGEGCVSSRKKRERWKRLREGMMGVGNVRRDGRVDGRKGKMKGSRGTEGGKWKEGMVRGKAALTDRDQVSHVVVNMDQRKEQSGCQNNDEGVNVQDGRTRTKG